jgi:hypothetical protein
MKATIHDKGKRRARINLHIMVHQHTSWMPKELIPSRILEMLSKTRMARIVRSTREESRILQHRKFRRVVHLRTQIPIFMEFHQLKVVQNERQAGLLRKSLILRDKTNRYPIRRRISKQTIHTTTHYRVQGGTSPLQSTGQSWEPSSSASNLT